MSHNFEVKQLPEDTAIMACKCGLTYRWYRNAWKLVGFEDWRGVDIDPPEGDCGASIDLTGEIVEEAK
jgi:hypothetical protein